MKKEILDNGVRKFTFNGVDRDKVEIHSYPSLHEASREHYYFDITIKKPGSKDTTVFIDLTTQEVEHLASYLLSHRNARAQSARGLIRPGIDDTLIPYQGDIMESSLDRVTMKSDEFYRLMIEAHLQAALVLANSGNEYERWEADGKPSRGKLHGQPLPARGYQVLTVGSMMRINRYLEDLRQRIEFVGNSLDETISATWDEFSRYAIPNYRVKG